MVGKFVVVFVGIVVAVLIVVVVAVVVVVLELGREELTHVHHMQVIIRMNQVTDYKHINKPRRN